MALDQQSCVPCRGGIPPLTRAEAVRLLGETPQWRLADDASQIDREFTFKDFKASLGFVNQVGALAEQEGHHPDITFGWGYAKVALYTHKIHGLHQNDFILAAKIDRLI